MRSSRVARVSSIGVDGIGRVQLVQVDPVGLQAAQRRLDGQPDVASRSASAPVGPVRAAHVHAELGREHDPVALAGERLAHQGLRQPAFRAVDVSGVEEGHAGIDRRADHGVGPRLALGCGSLPSEVVAAEADRGDDEAGVSEGAIFDLSHASRLAARHAGPTGGARRRSRGQPTGRFPRPSGTGMEASRRAV